MAGLIAWSKMYAAISTLVVLDKLVPETWKLQAAEVTAAHRQRLLTAKRAKYTQPQLEPGQLAGHLQLALQALKAAKPAGSLHHLAALQAARPLLSVGEQVYADVQVCLHGHLC